MFGGADGMYGSTVYVGYCRGIPCSPTYYYIYIKLQKKKITNFAILAISNVALPAACIVSCNPKRRAPCCLVCSPVQTCISVSLMAIEISFVNYKPTEQNNMISHNFLRTISSNFILNYILLKSHNCYLLGIR